MPPMTRKARRSALRIWPLGVADRPARARGRGAFPQGYIRTGATSPGGGVGVPHQVPHQPHRLTAPAVKNGGVAPVQSLPAGASRVVRSRTKNTNVDSEKWTRGVPHHPLSYCHTPPCVSVAFRLPCALPRNGTETRGTIRSPASGPVSRTVDQIWKRSIATRAFVVVGVPSGSCRSALSR